MVSCVLHIHLGPHMYIHAHITYTDAPEYTCIYDSRACASPSQLSTCMCTRSDRIIGRSFPAHAREFGPGISPRNGRRGDNKQDNKYILKNAQNVLYCCLVKLLVRHHCLYAR